MVAVRKTQYAALCSLVATIVAAGCGSTQSGSTSASPMQQGSPDMSAPLLAAPSPDPRVGLKGGLQDAGEAIWNVRKVSHTPSPEGFAGVTNSDLAFHGTNVIQGLDSFPADGRPTISQVNIVHLCWDIMVGIGTLLFLPRYAL